MDQADRTDAKGCRKGGRGLLLVKGEIAVMSIESKITNLSQYVIDMSKYHLQSFIERHSKFDLDRNYVLMFHNIVKDASNIQDVEYSISVSGFMELIEKLFFYGFKFCDVYEFVNNINTSKILLTFDDAYSGVYTELYDFLNSKQIPFVVFITSDFIDKEGYLSTNMIKEMLKYDKFTLGAHTISHCNLYESKDPKREIIEPIETFERKFGIKPEVFAYPYGAFVTLNLKSVKLVKNNYQYAFSTCGTCCKKIKGIKKYLIPRINMNEYNFPIFLEKVKNS